MVIICKDGATITYAGNIIRVANGVAATEVYTLNGNVLSGSNGFLAQNVGSLGEAVGIVIGLHGGKIF